MRDNAKSGALTEVTFFVLLSLYEPKHGYAIMQFIEEKTCGRLVLGAGSLYGAIDSLYKKGWIELFNDTDVRKKEYRITELGRQIAEQELSRLRKVTRIAEDIIGG
ncbi:MAG: PadR family transcriptional regulator [Oscillospiraceae bacterium]|nr:PadR family transcriptional regulator [Oscillospiraceae bacterium]